MQIDTPPGPHLDTGQNAQLTFSHAQELLSRCDVQQAIEYFNLAQQSGYPADECAAARWNCWMLLGNFEHAWQESDFISSLEIADPNGLWDGSSWEGKRVMLRCLHGLGDTIQFIRYARQLKQTCRSLTVQTHPQLVTLIEGVLGVDRVCTWATNYVENRSDWDMQMEVTELPRAFRTLPSTIPATVPYIFIPQDRIEWGARCVGVEKALRVGLCWESGPWDPARTISLSDLSILFSCADCRFYSLQKHANVPDYQNLIVDLEANSVDVRDTAALILNLDLVITVDTIAAHLAGALGRPTWLLLPAQCDWRWMLNRTDTPWYPTMRLFRQHKSGSWNPVITEVFAALAEASK
jgi:hypothetical protein